jgi:hypothetical protein
LTTSESVSLSSRLLRIRGFRVSENAIRESLLDGKVNRSCFFLGGKGADQSLRSDIRIVANMLQARVEDPSKCFVFRDMLARRDTPNPRLVAIADS